MKNKEVKEVKERVIDELITAQSDLTRSEKNKIKKNGLQLYFILANGNLESFILTKFKRKFERNKKTYVIDDQAIFYDKKNKCNALLYHENVALPLKIISVGSTSYSLKVDPQTLKSVIKLEYVELLTKVASMKDKIVIMVLLAGFSAIISTITLIVLLKTSGMI